GRSSWSYSLITETAQVPEPGQASEWARVPGLASELEQALRAQVQALQAPGPASSRPAARKSRGRARHRFCQKHNTQQWPG
ncbi:hypothetical protein, partial [Mesorhizobium sp.]|uniref:hypothetical protein n=1 Tax=Mesorhizobium sp. TaxID=1871066 RepID=UPI0025B94063